MQWNTIITGKQLRCKQYNDSYCVYGWFRSGVCLYIGHTINIKQRWSNHVVKRETPLLDSDEIRVLHYKNKKDSCKKELELIFRFQPQYNKFGKQKTKRKLTDEEKAERLLIRRVARICRAL